MNNKLVAWAMAAVWLAGASGWATTGTLMHRAVGPELTQTEYESPYAIYVYAGEDGDLLYYSVISGTVVALNAGATSEVLTVGADGLPTWSAAITTGTLVTGTEWGRITGTLADQADLLAALNGKVDETTSETISLERLDIYEAVVIGNWSVADDYDLKIYYRGEERAALQTSGTMIVWNDIYTTDGRRYVTDDELEGIETTTPTLSQVIAQGNNTALDPVDHATTATNLDVDGDTELLQLYTADWLTSGAVSATTQTVYGMALEYMELTTTSQAIMPAPLCAPNNYSGGTIDVRALCLSGESATVRLGYVSYGAIEDGDIASIAVEPTWIELAVDPDTPGDVGLTGDWLTGQSLGWVAGAPFQLIIESPDAAGQPGTVGVVLLEIKYPIDHVASGE